MYGSERKNAAVGQDEDGAHGRLALYAGGGWLERQVEVQRVGREVQAVLTRAKYQHLSTRGSHEGKRRMGTHEDDGKTNL